MIFIRTWYGEGTAETLSYLFRLAKILCKETFGKFLFIMR